MPYIMKKTGGKYPLFSDGSGGFNQPWKEVPEPPSPFLLDTVGDAYIAVSMRKLKSDATLAFQAFRPDNGTFQDIGFSGDYVDLNALYTFTGTFSSYVSKWYDQSGGGRDLIALDYDQSNVFCTPTQSGVNNVNCWGPRIIHNGIVASQSAMIGPDFKYTGFTASSALKYKQVYGATQAFYFGAFYRNSGSGTPIIFDRDNLVSGSGRHLLYWVTANGTNYEIWNPNNTVIMNGSNFTAINNKVNYSVRLKANNHQIYWNSSSGSNTNTNLVAGHNSNPGFTLGQIQGFVNGGALINQIYGFIGIIAEQLVYERNLTDSEMTTIQDNQETYYNI